VAGQPGLQHFPGRTRFFSVSFTLSRASRACWSPDSSVVRAPRNDASLQPAQCVRRRALAGACWRPATAPSSLFARAHALARAFGRADHRVWSAPCRLENFIFDTEGPDAHLKLIDFGLGKKYGTGIKRMHTLVGA
jgi:hypothetical protein